MSSDSPKPSFKSVEVNIFNQVYSLRTNRDTEHIKRIAGLVDERMRLISAHATAHDLAKIAIFAALNLADELSDTREHYEREFQRLLTNAPAAAADGGEETGRAGEPERVEENATEEPRKSEDRQSWFEDIFDAPESETARNRSERLSSKVSAKLQSLRQPPKQETSFAIEDDD
ncbi:MAG TPA: cell division protein ZapA [Pyrinomonadaceae bacterium]|nr:cell division protein ZapA [Pyrinomonadaceae bacterium]